MRLNSLMSPPDRQCPPIRTVPWLKLLRLPENPASRLWAIWSGCAFRNDRRTVARNASDRQRLLAANPYLAGLIPWSKEARSIPCR